MVRLLQHETEAFQKEGTRRYVVTWLRYILNNVLGCIGQLKRCRTILSVFTLTFSVQPGACKNSSPASRFFVTHSMVATSHTGSDPKERGAAH